MLALNLDLSDAFRDMLDSVHMPFDECKELLKKSEFQSTVPSEKHS